MCLAFCVMIHRHDHLIRRESEATRSVASSPQSAGPGTVAPESLNMTCFFDFLGKADPRHVCIAVKGTDILIGFQDIWNIL